MTKTPLATLATLLLTTVGMTLTILLGKFVSGGIEQPAWDYEFGRLPRRNYHLQNLIINQAEVQFDVARAP